MNNGFVITSQQFFEELSGIKAAVQESPDRSLSEKNPARNTFIKEEINSNFELTQNALNATTKVAKDEKRQEHGNMDNSSSTTMTLLAATYSSQDAIKDATTDKDMSCVTLDNEPSLPTVSTSSLSRISTRYNGLASKNYEKSTKKYSFHSRKKRTSDNNDPIGKRKKSRRQHWKFLRQIMAEKRERLKLEAEKLKELGLDNIIDIVAKKPVDRIPPPSAPESPPKIQSIYASEDAGYQKGGYRFRNAKRPSNYHPDALQEWNAKLEAEKEEHERQKLVEFKEEKKMTVLLRRRNNKAKKMKLLKVFKNDCATSQSSNKDADNDDVKIVKVVTKPNQKPASTSSKIGKHLDESLSIEKSKKNFRILNPPSRPEHLPVVCFPPSSIRRAPLHTLPNIKKTSSMASQSGKPFVDDCFIFVPCSTPSSSTSSSYNVTVPPPPTIKSTTSKRVLVKQKEPTILGSEWDVQETVADECFRTVSCSTPSLLGNTTPQTKPSPPKMISQTSAASVSSITVPITSQPTFVSQFSTIPATNAPSIPAPLQSPQYQTITIPANMLPPPGTPLQIVFVLPNGAAPISNNSINISSPPIIVQQQPPSLSTDIKPINVKSEIKE